MQVELGLYAKDDPENFLSNPEDIADRMIRGLILSSFDLVNPLVFFTMIEMSYENRSDFWGGGGATVDILISFMPKLSLTKP